jgi:hypothetical protein
MNSICLMLRRFFRKPNLRRLPGRFKVRDASIPMALTYRMRGLFPGSVTRTHPQWIEPCKVDPSLLPVAPGMAVKLNAAGDAVTPYVAGDTGVTQIYGVVCRVYPWQPTVLNVDGSATTAVPICDVLREGYIGMTCTGTAKKDGSVFIKLADGSAATATGSGITAALITNARFNGPADAGGVAEVVVSLHQ